MAWIDPSLLHTRRERRTPDLAIRRNTYDITLKGSRLMLTLNGVKTVDVENSQRASGPFALQWGPKLKCEDVRIRVLGDTAIIHARTVYLKPDGQPGAGRYTDIWMRRDGRWLCVSAHVTRG